MRFNRDLFERAVLAFAVLTIALCLMAVLIIDGMRKQDRFIEGKAAVKAELDEKK